MKFAWKIPPGLHKAGVERFLSTGAPKPHGREDHWTLAHSRVLFRIGC